MSDLYAAISAHWGQCPVPLMCRALDVSLCGYYEAKTRPAQGPSVRARADERLLVHVRAAFTKSHGRYGAPRILRARVPQAFVCTTDSRHAHPIAPNLLERRFAITDHPVPNRTWVAT